MPTFSNIANDAQTTLASAHTNGDGVFVVTSSTGFPAPPFRVSASTGIFNITGVSGTSWTIGSMLEGTSDLSLSAGTVVELRITAGLFQDAYTAVNSILVMSSKGDVIVGLTSGTPTRLAVGTNGQVLTADSTQTAGIKWSTPSSGGSPAGTTGSIQYNNGGSFAGSSSFSYDSASGSMSLNQAGATVTSSYALSIQNTTSTSTWMEIINSGGAGKGAYFGMTTNTFEMWNYQGGAIQFYTSTTAQTGTVRMRIENDGTIGIGSGSNTPTGQLYVVSNSSTRKALILQGATSQTGNLTEWQNSSGTPMSVIDANGYGFLERIVFTLAMDGNDLATGTNLTKVGHLAGYAGKIVKWKAKAATNGGSGGFTFDINLNGTSILWAPHAVAASTTTVQSGSTLFQTAVSEGDEFTVDVTAVGTGVKYVNITLYIQTRNQ